MEGGREGEGPAVTRAGSRKVELTLIGWGVASLSALGAIWEDRERGSPWGKQDPLLLKQAACRVSDGVYLLSEQPREQSQGLGWASVPCVWAGLRLRLSQRKGQAAGRLREGVCRTRSKG